MAILDIPTLTDCGCKAKVYQDGSGVDLEYCNKHRAAPDLLAALVDLTNAADERFTDADPYRTIIKQARTAIARAKGE